MWSPCADVPCAENDLPQTGSHSARAISAKSPLQGHGNCLACQRRYELLLPNVPSRVFMCSVIASSRHPLLFVLRLMQPQLQPKGFYCSPPSDSRGNDMGTLRKDGGDVGQRKRTSAKCLAVSRFTTRNNSRGPGHAFILRARISRNRSLRSMTVFCTWLSGGPLPQLPGAVAPWTTLCSKAQRLPT